MTQYKTLMADWFGRSALEVAPDLVGCTLVRQFADGRQLRGMIVETEAYESGDPACHAYQRRTPRNAVMFGPSGYVYVYLIYGRYHCVNFVTDRDEFASAVLIRALWLEEWPAGFADLKADLKADSKSKLDRIAAGPGKLCTVMEIDRSLSGLPLGLEAGLWVEARSSGAALDLVQTTRIGLTKGVELPWRWYLRGCGAVSKI